MVTEQKNSGHGYNVDSVCVQVFTTVIASVSHEIKNVLAIINENGGLLNDLVIMGGAAGQGVAPERVKAATSSISRQVHRANMIMRNCNRLAHLGDTKLGQESLSEILELMAALANRQAGMKNVTIHVDCPDGLQITALKLPLASLIYLLLQTMIAVDAGTAAIQIGARMNGTEIVILFERKLVEIECVDIFDKPQVKNLLLVLGASYSVGGQGIKIILPVDNQQQAA